MNELIVSIILAIVQGITEWLPISSSGHLAIFEEILGYRADLMFDVALHFGTLMAVFVYFGKDITDIIGDVLRGRFRSENGRMGLMIIVASIPVGIVGFLFEDLFEGLFDNLLLTAFGFAITGIVLFIASMNLGSKKEMSYNDALLIGLAQVIAILPGISRSGMTISSGLMRGLDAKKAAKFSFLMSIPVIFGANILVVGNNPLPSNLIWASLVAFLSGLLVMHFMFKVVLTSKKNMRWFSAYAILLAAALFVYILLF